MRHGGDVMNCCYPGIDDQLFIRGNIPMTKQEVRILVLNKARIGAQDIVLDIGAGTGSLTVEAALLARQGRVYAVEREEEGIELIKANASKFGAENIEVILGMAPECLAGVPSVDVVFVGGSGGSLRSILHSADLLLKTGGRMIITAVTVETLNEALTVMRQAPVYKVEAAGISVTRLRLVGEKNMFQALNPVYIITCTKGERTC
jgi:cobalt-precorrin-6B (C15)-methyltransferase